MRPRFEEGIAASMDPLYGGDPAQVASYRVSARLGAGGMGQVYLAHTPGGRPVALTVVRPELGADPGFRQRFRHDLDAARRVHGLGTVQVLDADPDGTPPWLVTAYIPGPSLQQAVALHGPMPPDSVFELMAGVAEALEAIHAAGVVHRDLKPSNVFLASDGPRVTGFGIAQAVGTAADKRQGARAGASLFLAPEQVHGRPPAPATDVFALGHVAAFAVLGHSPFDSGDPAAVIDHILYQPADLAACPQPLRSLIEPCLSKDPDARPVAADVAAACREHQGELTARAGAAWLPPAVAALARHAAPPPPGYLAGQTPPAYPVSGVPHARSGVRFPRTAMVRSAVAVVVIGALAGLGIVLLNGSGSKGAAAVPSSSSTVPVAAASRPPSPAASTTPAPSSPAPGLDSCVIGTWNVASQTVTNYPGGEPVEFTGHGPGSFFLRPDGTGAAGATPGVSTASGDVLTARVGAAVWTEVVRGTSTFDYQTSDGSLLFSNVQATGTQTLYVNGFKVVTAPFSPKTSARYTCSGNTLRIFSADGTGSTELTRA